MMKRRKTREVKIGDLIVGGEHAISVQSMTTTKTHDITATLKEVERLEEAGCQIIRITVPDQPAADALYEIKKRMNVPLVADIHFNYRMALEAVDAGADKIRINPGNIGGKKTGERSVEKSERSQPSHPDRRECRQPRKRFD
jgi:(E)-4-hydroxy-3-methylbut-2-enyl-diphosphate synthase